MRTIGNLQISGSLLTSGSITATTFIGDGSGLSGTYTNSDTLSYINSLNVVSSSAQLSTEISGAFVSTSASLASNISNNDSRLTTLEGKTLISSSIQLSNQTIPGNLTVGGILTAQEFHTEFVSASIIYDSGSTQFGNSLDDIHNFSGSLAVNTNNLFVSGGRVGIGTSSPGAKLDVNGTVTGGKFVPTANTVTGNGMFLPTTNTLGFSTNGSEKMRIDSNGNIGIGTTNPNTYSTFTNLQVNGPDAGLIQVTDSSSTIGSFYGGNGLVNLGSTSNHPLSIFTNDVSRLYITNSGNVGIGTTSPSRLLHLSSSNDVYIRVDRGSLQSLFGTDNVGAYIGMQSDAPIRLITNSNERMRITSNGNVGIGTTSPQSKLDVEGGAVIGATYSGTNTAPTNGLLVEGNVGIGTSSPVNRLAVSNDATYNSENSYAISSTSNTDIAYKTIIGYDYANDIGVIAAVRQGVTWKNLSILPVGNTNLGVGTITPSYTLHVNGSVAGVGAYNNLSDINWKKNINDLSYGLDKLLQLRPITFNWLNEQYGDRLNTGFIAQEVEDILPDMVTTADDGVKSLATTDLIPLLVKSIQELKAEIDELRSEINLLKNQ